MAASQRVLQMTPAGTIQDYVAPQVSAGAPSAGFLPATGNDGRLDSSFMPAGFGVDVATITTSESLAAGAYVNIWSNSGAFAARNADANSVNKQADGFVLQAYASGVPALVYLGGVNTSVSGQAPGRVFLSDTTIGAGTATAPTAAGRIVQQIGIAVAAGAVQFDPQETVLRG